MEPVETCIVLMIKNQLVPNKIYLQNIKTEPVETCTVLVIRNQLVPNKIYLQHIKTEPVERCTGFSDTKSTGSWKKLPNYPNYLVCVHVLYK